MPKSTSTRTVDKQAAVKVRAYMARLPPPQRRAMKNLRAVIRAAAPRAVDGFSYGIPGFKIGERWLLSYAAWKNHASMYPVSPAIARAAGVTGYECFKGTMQFPWDNQPSAAVVKRLVKALVARSRRKY